MKKIQFSFFKFFLVCFFAAAVPALAVEESTALDEGQAQLASVETVNLNTATAEELAESLAGIGLSKAKRIVAYRDAYGPFARIEDLLEVKGVGMATLEKNRAKLSL